MFLKAQPLNAQLYELIEAGRLDKAISLIQSNELDKIAHLTGVIWVKRKMADSKNPSNWIEFSCQLIFSDLGEDKKQLQKEFRDRSLKDSVITQSCDFICRVIEHLRLPDIENLARLIVQQPLPNQFAIMLLNRIEPPQLKSVFYEALVKMSHHKYAGSLLQELNKLSSDLLNFEQAINKIRLNSDGKALLEKLMSLDEEKANFIHEKMRAFVHGFGNIKYEDALLAVAERKERKKSYDFNPVVLDENEFKDYLTILKESSGLCAERFVLSSSSHWVVGEIGIIEDEVKILFIDSLGTTGLELLTKNAKITREVFPNSEILLSQEKRQGSLLGCSVFALDDMAHLFTLHLPGKESKLINYAVDSAMEVVECKTEDIDDIEDGDVIPITPYKLPLSLTRTMQSKSLVTEVIPQKSKSEQMHPLNKAGETAEQSATKFYKISGTGELQNTRLTYKLDQMAKHIADFLFNNSIEQVEMLLQTPTLKKFKEKMLEKGAGQTPISVEDSIKTTRRFKESSTAVEKPSVEDDMSKAPTKS